MFIWIVFSDAIPDPDEATGWPAQVFALAAAAGTFPTAIIAGVLVFVLGAVGSVSVEPVATIVGRISAASRRKIVWQRHAHGSRRRLARRIEDLSQATSEPSTADAADDSTRTGKNQEARRRRLHRELEQAKERASVVPASGLQRFWVHDSPEARKALGQPPPEAGEGLELQLVEAAHERAVDLALQTRGIDASLEEVTQSAGSHNVLPEVADRLTAEMQPDPLDTLRALDEGLYLDLDRERAEHDVRLAASVPFVVGALYGSFHWSAWLLAVALLGVIVFVKSAIARSIERSRVLKLISLRGLETEALRRAAVLGQDAVRGFVASHAQQPEDREELPEAQVRDANR